MHMALKLPDYHLATTVKYLEDFFLYISEQLILTQNLTLDSTLAIFLLLV